MKGREEKGRIKGSSGIENIGEEVEDGVGEKGRGDGGVVGCGVDGGGGDEKVGR